MSLAEMMRFHQIVEHKKKGSASGTAHMIWGGSLSRHISLGNSEFDIAWMRTRLSNPVLVYNQLKAIHFHWDFLNGTSLWSKKEDEINLAKEDPKISQRNNHNAINHVEITSTSWVICHEVNFVEFRIDLWMSTSASDENWARQICWWGPDIWGLCDWIRRTILDSTQVIT